MKKAILTIAVLFVVILSSCKEKKPEFAGFTGYAQGTSYSIVFERKRRLNPDKLKVEVERILDDFDMSLSLYKDSSILSRINRNEDVIADTYFTEAYKKSVIIYEMTSGTFDITVGPLVRAWGFGPDTKKNITESKRDSLLKLVGMNKVSLVNRRLVKTDPRISLDFNAIAQGYSVDVLCAFFDRRRIKNYLIEIGGEVRGKGTKAGLLWRIGIDKPVDGNMLPGENLQAIIKISDKAIATSGNYRKFFIEDGVKYSHHVDPKTGNISKNNLLSVTILADECAMADGIATGCLVMGKERAIEFINNHPQYGGYLIFSDESGNFVTWISENLKENISEQ